MMQPAWLEDPFVKAFPETNPFWEAAARDVFVVPQCAQCGKRHWHPRAHCPFCQSTQIAWATASGFGEIYSYSIIRRRDAPSHVLAYVKLDEGPLMMTNIVDCDMEKIRSGMRVKLRFRPTAEGRMAPVFAPEGSATATVAD